VTFPSRTAVCAETCRVEIRLEDDPRLIAGVCSAVSFYAGTTGLSEAAVAGLSAAIAGACREAFGQEHEPRARVEITLHRYPDRIEVALSCPGSEAPAVGLETLAGLAQQAGGGRNPFLAGGVDRVQYETRGGVALTRLTKYLEPPAPSA
jgi:hypothetical protein